MRGVSALVLLGAVGATAGLVVTLLIAPGRWDPAARSYALFVGGLGLLYLVRALRDAFPRDDRRAFERLARRPRGPRREPVPELARVERALLLGEATLGDAHHGLRRLLREIARTRLSTRHGIDLDGETGAAAEALGPEAWELLRPERPPPIDRHAKGLRREQTRELVEALERL